MACDNQDMSILCTILRDILKSQPSFRCQVFLCKTTFQYSDEYIYIYIYIYIYMYMYIVCVYC